MYILSCLSSNLGSFQPLFFSIIFSAPFSFLLLNSHNVSMVHLVSLRSLKLYSLLQYIFFSAPWTWQLPLFYIKIVDSAFCLLKLALNPSGEFFSFCFTTFLPQNFCLVSFRYSVSLWVFPFCSFIVFLTFSTYSFRLLSIYMIVVLKSL